MSEKAPAFQFYPKDWLSDANVKAMTLDAKGAYIELLCVYWLEDGLPASTDRLARLIGVAPAKFRRLWPQIEPCFILDGDRLRQKRADRERAKQAAFKAGRSTAGLKGANSRWSNRARMAQPSTQDGTAKRLTKATDSSPSPSPSATPTHGNELPPAAEIPPAPAKRTWANDAADDWKAAKGGAAPPSIFPALKAAVTAHGWESVRPVWRWYLAATAAEYVSVPKFVAAFGEWEKRARGAPPPGNGAAGAKPSVGDRAVENARKFIEGGKAT